MSSYLRLAGTARLADGARLEWTVADGGRGRRWRAVATIDGHITHALLLEVALDRSVSRLELTTPGGLLTLHPDTNGATLHGNAVTTDGVRHLSYAWGPNHAVAVAGRPIADAVTAHRLAATVGVGESRAIRALVIARPAALFDEAETPIEPNGRCVIDCHFQEKAARAACGCSDNRGIQQSPSGAGAPPFGYRADRQDFRLVGSDPP